MPIGLRPSETPCDMVHNQKAMYSTKRCELTRVRHRWTLAYVVIADARFALRPG